MLTLYKHFLKLESSSCIISKASEQGFSFFFFFFENIKKIGHGHAAWIQGQHSFVK